MVLIADHDAHLPELLERVKGIEPSLSAWEADVLPLNYTRERHQPYMLGCRGARTVAACRHA
jgi:hypothetical protein